MVNLRKLYRIVIIAFCLVFHSGVLKAGDPVANTVGLNRLDTGHEGMLINVMEKIRRGEIQNAINNLEVLVEAYPNYRLAQLIYADLLMARSRPLRDFGSLQSAPYERISVLLDEARARWQHYQSPPPSNKLPAALITLSENQRHVIVVDMNASRLYLYENHNGIPELVQDFYATIGKNGTGKIVEGDQKTPVGVYFVTGFIDPEKLPDLYGEGAFPIDYPNVWDKRHGRTGYGIWLHGTPSNTFNRPPRDSDGCVILSNRDLLLMATYIQDEETPVLLTENIEWLDKREWMQRQSGYASLLDVWREDWESRDANRYLSHYSRNYAGLGMDYVSWVEHKQRVNPSKSYIKVGIKQKSIFLYPGEENMLVVTFTQEYESDNFQTSFVKRQYWRMEKDGKWRIIYEGSIS